MNGFTPIRGKCLFWREQPNPDDQYDTRLQQSERRVRCTCFIEGHGWTYTAGAVPQDCPDFRRCRYYIRNA